MLPLSEKFWPFYEQIKSHKQIFRAPKSEVSLPVKALNNLQTALKIFKTELQGQLPFIRMLVKDLKRYQTLSKYSLRRLANHELNPEKPRELQRFKAEVKYLQKQLGDNYLDIIQKRIANNYHEIIIAVENQK